MPSYSQPQSYLSTITGTVLSKFQETKNYASEAWNAALEYLSALSNMVTGFRFDPVTLEYDITPISVNDYTPTAPTKPNLALTLPNSPQTPEFSSVTITPVEIPSLDVVAPTITLPDTPDVEFPTDPGEAPTLADIEYPTKPDYELPAVPVIEDLDIPSLPDITLPTFEAVAPVFDIAPPADTFSYSEGPYQSDLQDAVKDKLKDDIEQSGTGLNPDVENAIWDRAQSRQQTLNDRTHQEAENFLAARGWSAPPEVTNARVAEAHKESTRGDEQLDHEIQIEKARLAQDNIKFVIQAAIQLEGQLITHINNVADRSFQAAKYTQEAAITIFNSAIMRYNAKLNGYKVAADVYDSRIRASALELDRYRTHLEGTKVAAEVKRQQVDIYRIQVSAVEAMMNLYRTEMESARIQSEVERLRLEGYREKVNAYNAKLGAITTRYNAYQAQISGEVEKAKLYSEQVHAYTTQVQATRTKADINIAEAQTKIEHNRQLIEQYRTYILKYNSDIQAKLGELESLARVYGYQIEGYKADTQLANTRINGMIGAYDAQSRHETSRINSMLEQANLNLAAVLKAHDIQLEAMEAGSNIAAQMTAGALSSVSAEASLSYRGGYDHTRTERSSEEYDTTHRHSYQEKCCN